MMQLPLLTPESSWVRPRTLPDLRKRPIVAIDTEEDDHGLSNGRGPGWATRSGKILGVSWAAEGSRGYAPIAHPDSDNFDKAVVARWMQDHVDAGVRFVFQNAPYDIGWIWADLGVTIPFKYPIEDVLCGEFMTDENHYEYNLDAICARRGIGGKDERLLTEAAEAYLRPANAPRSWRLKRKDIKKNMGRLPARYVGTYAEADAAQTLEAWGLIEPDLRDQKVWDAYRREMNLVPVVRQMRARGIKLDIDYILRQKKNFAGKLDAVMSELKRRLPGRGLSDISQIRSSKFLDPIFFDEGIQVPRTEATRTHADGQSSYKQEWMEKHEHWLPKLVSRALQYDRFNSIFLDEYLLGFAHRGRIHAEVHQYKSDDGGTVSYRFAYSAPPLQQAPSIDIDPEFGLAFRQAFVADDDAVWGANDYSQQEYRLTAHFAAAAKVRGGRAAAQKFVEDPKLDFHEMVAGLTGLSRAKAKIQNFALLYGQGLDATASKLGISREDAEALRKQVSDKAPFGPALDEYARSLASARGYLVLLDGARVRFDEWEGGWMEKSEWERARSENWPMEPCSREEAEARKANPKHPWHKTRLRRADVRKSLNRLIQGSAARQTKMAMEACAEEGLVPVLQMHDELDHVEDSVAKIHRVSEIMRDVCPLRVPMLVDAGLGLSWADAKLDDAKRAKLGLPPKKPLPARGIKPARKSSRTRSV